ncbi:retropepsin-like aspartic protease [Oceanicoccus sagamiensis]|uniref:Peptidase A2 domain-containing protein n=1 Tax=Oceanicoccus sagamiensis TaxID=716816 RepID=A0A1X9NAC2_9GAMM|nr:retropepsin-like aspartic protease [Oceanicoccus sagamiensis]ARN74576.1 hypothetical protein BST96_10850 [Oceanicoccus sagamiensis]
MFKVILNTVVVLLVFYLGWLAREWSLPDAESTVVASSSFITDNRAAAQIYPGAKPQPKQQQAVAPSFNALLVARAFDEAIEVYDETVAIDEVRAAQYRQTLLKYLRLRLDNNDAPALMALIDLYLSRYYDDIEVLLVLAEFQRRQGYVDEAARVFQLAFTYAFQPAQKQRVSDSFISFVNAVDGALSQQQRWLELQAFYELLASIDLSGPGYSWRLANLYVQSGDRVAAYDLLLQLQENGFYVDETNRLLVLLEQDQAGDYTAAARDSIALVKKGNHYLVQVMLNKTTEATLMIDTGASVTSLSADSFAALSQYTPLHYVGSRLFNTANGVTQGDVYSAASLSLGNQELSDINIAVLDFQSSPGVDGLLGMNVLQNFRFEIDQDKQQLLLSPR